jgi:hypothetical protein
MHISSCGFNPHFIRVQRSQVMIGERSIVDPLGRTIRPVIRLADNAPNFQGGALAGGDGHSRPVVDFTMTTASNHPTEVRASACRAPPSTLPLHTHLHTTSVPPTPASAARVFFALDLHAHPCAQTAASCHTQLHFSTTTGQRHQLQPALQRH